MKRQAIKRSGRLRTTSLKKVGPMAIKWKKFRDEKFDRDKNEDGLVKCQDYLLGLPRCGIARISMDLHHLVGRQERPDLYFRDSNLVWLTRECHNAAHSNNSDQASTETQNDAKRRMEKASSGHTVLSVQRRLEDIGERQLKPAILGDFLRTDAAIMEHHKKGRLLFKAPPTET